ncbi:ionotropic receptor 21a, partial [Musca vetustissima]|uniref:ionotropic receptor 21a n=1 Tax=Musca vetustissima TaxID=27455 RepID=UPI002AB6BFDF
ERPYVLYTHKLYADGLGSNKPVVLTSWLRGGLTRPHINLYPKKFENGFAGHRFQVMAVNQPPYIFRIKTLDFTGVTQVHWDGIEYRLLQMMGQKLNFSIDILDNTYGGRNERPLELLEYSVAERLVDIGMAGMYVSTDKLENVDFSVGHSKDCAAFITLASKALPKYRAIMGPFQWPVWVALICIYLGAIFPIVFTDRLTLSHLLGNWGEIENMFWYVFGMFTNSLTFSGKYSWANTQKVSTRILIGSYWIFTIIITACYTGSIIAFVTLPAFPDTVDSVMDLLGLFFRVGTIDNGGWESWFQNSSHEPTARLFQKMEYVSSVEEGIGNVTQSFFWNYAFLGCLALVDPLIIVGGITNKCRQIIKRSRQSISSGWSSRRESIVAIPGQDMKRKGHPHKSREKKSFGWRQLNLTKTTLKELYGDNHEELQKGYKFKGGTTLNKNSYHNMESESNSDDALSLKSTVNEFINNERSNHSKTDIIEQVVDRFLKEELENTLKNFDQTLATYQEDEEDNSNGENDDYIRSPENNEEIFGSFVTSFLDENAKILDNLQLFKEHQENNEIPPEKEKNHTLK